MTWILWISALFLVTALLYSSVGFGGGSTYTALLVLAETDYRLIPVLSLTCNIIVVTGNVSYALKRKLVRRDLILPLLATSIPMSFIGGAMPVPELVFLVLLMLALAAAGLWLLFQPETMGEAAVPEAKPRKWPSALTGAGLGLLSGIVGIGGGIFLAPVLHIWRFARPREIAAICSVFILANSLAGIAGQFTRLVPGDLAADYFASWPLFLAVLAGGAMGRRLGFSMFPESLIRRMTALLILFVAIRLAFRVLG